MVSQQVSDFIDNCVRKSMDHYTVGLHDATAIAVAMDTSLNPSTDSFDMLALELMALRYRGQFNVE